MKDRQRKYGVRVYPFWGYYLTPILSHIYLADTEYPMKWVANEQPSSILMYNSICHTLKLDPFETEQS